MLPVFWLFMVAVLADGSESIRFRLCRIGLLFTFISLKYTLRTRYASRIDTASSVGSASIRCLLMIRQCSIECLHR